MYLQAPPNYLVRYDTVDVAVIFSGDDLPMVINPIIMVLT